MVGRRTFGKGVFGQVFELSNGGALDLIVGSYYTPNGENLNGKGIAPDVPRDGQPAAPSRTRRSTARSRRSPARAGRPRADDAARAAPASGRVGVVARRGRFTVVEPFFERGRAITVDVAARRDVRPGDLVLVQLRGRNGRGPRSSARSAGPTSRAT